MIEARTYSVADFRFALEAQTTLFERMQNLQPFLIDEKQDSNNIETLFSIRTSDSGMFFQPLDKEPTYSVCKGSDRPQTDIFAESECWRFRFRSRPERPVAGELVSDKDFSNASLCLNGIADVLCVNMAIKLMFTFATALLGALETHASVVSFEGSGYLFLGPSGTGKSTHSQLWLDNIPGTELLNDDYPVLRLMQDSSVRVFGSPWSGQTPCYRQVGAPVGAIVWLKQGNENKIQRLSVTDAYAALMTSTSAFRPISALADGWHRTLEGICTCIPFYFLVCTPDRSAAELCFQTIYTEKK